MKKFTVCFVFLCLSILLFGKDAFAANELFRSVATGNWNSNSTWEMSTNGGSSWIAATKTPNDSASTITVQSPNTVTVTVSVNADQLVVNTGGTISINSAINLTILDGSGNDLILNPGATITGSGNLQTQGSGVVLSIQNTSNFNAALKVNTGVATATNPGSPFTAVFNGTITVDASATLAANPGGYFIRAMNTVTNNGTISANGSTFTMRGSALTNNGIMNPSNLNFDTATSLSGTGTFTSTNININASGNVSLSSNVTFTPSVFTINSGGTFNPNTRTFTQNAGTFVCTSGGNVSSSGIFQTQGTVLMEPRSGSNFNGSLKVNTGTTTARDPGSPFVAYFKGTITVDAGAILNISSGYNIQANGTVTNNGTITAIGAIFIMRGSSLLNNGVINPASLNFDSTTSVFGTGTYTGANINVNGTGNITLQNNVTFSPTSAFTINTGGVFNPGSKTFTFNSGSFIINNGGIVAGSGPSAGTLQTQGSVNFIFRNGSVFNSGVKVNTGTLTAYNDGFPFNGIFYGNITVDAGATLTVLGGGYTSQANGTVTNNGTITSGLGSTYIIRGSSLVNNGVINPTNLNFDSTTSISGSGTFSSSNITINVNGQGNVSLSGNVTFSPTQVFTINGGGILNPNTRTFTLNSGTLSLSSGGTISNSGTFQTQGTVTLISRAGSNFNCPLKVNTGTATAYDSNNPFTAFFNGTITVDAGATLNVFGGGYSVRSNGNVTNNGTITSGGGSVFIMRGSTLTNAGTMNPATLNFDSTTSISGAGTFSSANININVNGQGNVSLSGNVTFSPTQFFTINGGGILNPNTRTFTLNSGTLSLSSGGTISNSGTFQTQGTVTLIPKSGSNFNAPLKVNTGTASAYDPSNPFTAYFNGTITIDAGATFTVNGGGYNTQANGNVINNGTLTSGGGSTFKFFGAGMTNNGIINPANFNFESGAHTLLGTGSWGTAANVLNGSNVTLTGNHQMQSVNVNSGGTFSLSTFRLSLTASNPIVNNGTFTATNGIVEYNGTSNQSISTTNVTYNRLRINNSVGTTLSDNETVIDTLSVLSGFLNLNGFVLTISPTGYLTETPGNTVRGTAGYLTTTRTINAPSSLNVGGFGAVLTTGVNLGSTEIRRGHAVQNGLSGNTSILRYFDITPTTNTGLNATLVFNFDESELNGKIESALSLFRSTNSGSTWTGQGGSVNTASNNITLTGIGSYSRWSASSPNAVTSTIKIIMEGFYNLSLIPNRLNMRDTVRAYLRNNFAPYSIVDSAKSILDSVTFTGSFLFANAPSGTYYIHIKHRNSLETWSKASGQTYTLGSALSYDFTDSLSKAFGNNMTQKSSKYCIYSGDVFQDGVIDGSDGLIVDNDAFNFESGYISSDVNGDRFVDGSDGSIVDNNAANFVSAVTP